RRATAPDPLKAGAPGDRLGLLGHSGQHARRPASMLTGEAEFAPILLPVLATPLLKLAPERGGPLEGVMGGIQTVLDRLSQVRGRPLHAPLSASHRRLEARALDHERRRPAQSPRQSNRRESPDPPFAGVPVVPADAVAKVG